MLRILAVALFGALVACTQSHQPLAASGADRNFHFIDDVPVVDRTYSLASGRPWDASERDRVRRDLAGLERKFPGLVQAATSGETIAVARVSAVYGRPRALASARREPRYLIIADRYYANGLRGPNHLGVDHGLWTLAHELAHIVDQRKDISRSEPWRRVVRLRIAAFKLALAGEGKTLEDEIDAARNDVAMSYGLPSTYAASTVTEAFAEYVGAYLLAPDFRMPYEVRDFIRQIIRP